ncbi:MAG: N-acetyltransferase [Myxococcota bacterium]
MTTGSDPSLRIEPARLRDAPHTLSLHRTVLEEGRWFVARPEELWTTPTLRERDIRKLSESDNGCFLVARLAEVPVAGFLTLTGGLWARSRHVGRIELMVGARYRGRGIGKALLREAIAFAERSPILTKLALAVFADNDRAIGLYQSLGFVEEGRRRGEYREADGTRRDDLLMARAV